jgi:hypothetical protein
MKDISRDHPLRKLFRGVTQNAFRFNQELHTGAIEEYFSDWLLVRFVHSDNLWKIRNARGRRLSDVAGMLAGGIPHTKSQERELALHQHIGDYLLFMVGLFPDGLARAAGLPGSPDGLLVKVGALFHPCASPMDFYIHQGQASYRKASEFMRGLSEETAGVLARLSEEFTSYVNVMGLIRLNLESFSFFRDMKGLMGSA